jgi:hypothetical protein
MNDLASREALRHLADLSVAMMFAGADVVITHEEGWKRPIGWPLPKVKRAALVLHYRPMALLEYIEHALRPPKPRKADDDWSDLV